MNFAPSCRTPSFTGYLAGLDLARAFASADVFLFPSTTDTFGNVILEAMASGVPCIVSDQGGPKDLVVHGKTGYITRASMPTTSRGTSRRSPTTQRFAMK